MKKITRSVYLGATRVDGITETKGNGKLPRRSNLYW